MKCMSDDDLKICLICDKPLPCEDHYYKELCDGSFNEYFYIPTGKERGNHICVYNDYPNNRTRVAFVKDSKVVERSSRELIPSSNVEALKAFIKKIVILT
jgi:hypothetical protein